MTEKAKLVTSKPDSEVNDEDETAETNHAVALVGVSHEHLETQRGGETKSDQDKNEREQNTKEEAQPRIGVYVQRALK